MNALIACVGKLKESWQKEGCEEYLKRLSRYGKYEIGQVPDEPEPERPSDALSLQVMQKEGRVSSWLQNPRHLSRIRTRSADEAVSGPFCRSSP